LAFFSFSLIDDPSLTKSQIVAKKSYGNYYFLGVASNCQIQEGEDDYAVAAVRIADVLRYNNISTKYTEGLLLGRQATRENIISGIQNIANNMLEEDFAFIYLGTHGSLDVDKNDKYYMCPHDFTYDKGGIKNQIYGTEIRDILSNAKGTVVIVFDTCHAGGALKEWITNNRTVVIASCKEDQYSYGHAFPNVIIQSFRLGDTNGDRHISIDEFVDNVSSRIGNERYNVIFPFFRSGWMEVVNSPIPANHSIIASKW
jgi:hypothetical protein